MLHYETHSYDTPNGIGGVLKSVANIFFNMLCNKASEPAGALTFFDAAASENEQVAHAMLPQWGCISVDFSTKKVILASRKSGQLTCGKSLLKQVFD